MASAAGSNQQSGELLLDDGSDRPQDAVAVLINDVDRQPREAEIIFLGRGEEVFELVVQASGRTECVPTRICRSIKISCNKP